MNDHLRALPEKPRFWGFSTHSIALSILHSLHAFLLQRFSFGSSSLLYQYQLFLALYSIWYLSTHSAFFSRISKSKTQISDETGSPAELPSRDDVRSSFRAMSYAAVIFGAVLFLSICVIMGLEFARSLEEITISERSELENSFSFQMGEQFFSKETLSARSTAYIRHPALIALGGITLFVFVNSCWIAWNIERILSLELDAQNAREVAERANKAKSEFLSFLAHELRNPLHAILGIIHLVDKDTSISKIVKSRLSTISSCSQLMVTVLDDVLDMSKIESGSMKLEYIWFQFNRFFNDINQFGKMTAASKGLEWSSSINLPDDFSNSSFFALGDPTRLKQCVYNLISNGVKFTSAGLVSFKLNLEVLDKERCIPEATFSVAHDTKKCLLKLTVEDQGIGISAEQIPLLFKSFSQADISINRNFGGSGLGLSITKHLATQMGGNVSVKSKVNTGSEFTIELPLEISFNLPEDITCLSPDTSPTMDLIPDLRVRPEAQLSGRNLLSLECPKSGDAGNFSVGNSLNIEKLRKLRCLLVEDNELNRTVASLVLSGAGAEVVCAEDGIDAIEIWEKFFDIIFMDLTMPRLDGIETCRRLRSLGCKSVIVALTAHASPEEKRICIESGMDTVLTKPLRPKDLENFIRKMRKDAAPSLD